jgi:hypothetical protein
VQLAEAKLEELTTVTPLEINVLELNLGVLQKKLDTLADEVRRLEALKQRSPTTVPDRDLSTQQLLLAQSRADVQSGQVALQKARAAHQNSLKVAHAQLAAARSNQKFVGPINRARRWNRSSPWPNCNSTGPRSRPPGRAGS